MNQLSLRAILGVALLVAAPAAADPPATAPATAPAPPDALTAELDRAYREAAADPRVRAAEAPTLDAMIPAVSLDRYTLPNGLDVVLAPGGDERQVALVVRYGVGTGDVPPALAALPHLAEHLSYGPTRHCPDGLLLETERADATDYNGITHVDETGYFAVVPTGSLERILWVESERMAFALDGVTQAALDHERLVVVNEYRQRVAAGGHGDAALAIARELYPEGHLRRVPYALPDAIAAVTLDDVRRFLASAYVPANARLTLVGRFDPAAARRWIERYFGPIARAPAPPHPRPGGPGVLTGERLLRYRLPSPRSAVVVTWPTPALRAPGDAELDVASELLAAEPAGLLTRALVTTGLALSVDAGQRSHDDGSEFVVEAVVAPAHTADEVLDAIDRTLARARREAPPTAPFEAAARHFTRQVVDRAQSLLDRAMQITTAPDPADPARFRAELARYRAVTPEQVRAAMAQHLPLDRRLVVLFERSAGAPLSGVAEPVRSR